MIVKILILMVRAYQLAISPLIGQCCRFQPSCSAYCIEALREHGVFKGLWLSFRRICRCHPFHPGGVDLVPLKVSRGMERANNE